MNHRELNCCQHCPSDPPAATPRRQREPHMLGGPSLPIGLGIVLLGGIVGAGLGGAVPTLAALVLGLPTFGWLLTQLWGELMLERELRRPVQLDPLPVRHAIQSHDRPAISAPTLPPLRAGGFVIEGEVTR